MKRRFVWASMTALLLAAALTPPPMEAAPQESCASLASIALPDTTIKNGRGSRRAVVRSGWRRSAQQPARILPGGGRPSPP